jgi:fatty-acyl-CoA synthase
VGYVLATVEWLIVQIATAKIGAILVNPSYRTYELEYALNHSGCKSIVIADKKTSMRTTVKCFMN